MTPRMITRELRGDVLTLHCRLRHSAQFKGELCGDVLTLGYGSPFADRECCGGAPQLQNSKIDVINKPPPRTNCPRRLIGARRR